MFNERPFVSVLISCYNYQEYVARCLESCINQSFQDFEIIIVDDASTDNSPYIIAEFKNTHPYAKINFIRLKVNGGPAIAKGTALKHATGTYVIFVDCDDWMDSNCLEVLGECARFSKADKIRAQARIMDEESHKLIRERLIPSQPNVWTEGMMYATFIKRSLIVENNLEFCSERNVSDDLYFISEINSFVKTTEYIRKTIYTISYKANSHSGVANINIQSKLRISFYTNKKIFEDIIPKLSSQDKVLCEYLFTKQYYFMLLQYGRTFKYKNMLKYVSMLKKTMIPFFPKYYKNSNIKLTQNGDMFLFRLSVFVCALFDRFHLIKLLMSIYWIISKFVPFVTR